MKRPAPRSLALCLLPVVVLLCGYSCAVPLAPGYRIVTQSCEVHFVAGPPASIRVHFLYRLQNIGNADLSFMDVNFPPEKTFGRRNLQLELDGHAIAPASLPEEYQSSEPNALRISFNPAWARKQVRTLSVEYEFSSPENPGGRITLGETEFHLGSRDWFPDLQAPHHLMSANPKSPSPIMLRIIVPSGWLVLARGTPKGQKSQGRETEHRFVLAATDLPPFVVAGHYSVTPTTRRSNAATFWTLQPLKDDPVAAISQIAAAWKTLQTDFGSLDKNIASPHIVESPELTRRILGETEEGPAAAAFPGGAIVNSASLALGTSSPEFLDIITDALARNWFGDEIRPTTDSSIGIGEGLPEYAGIVIEEARNGPDGRRRRILDYLRRYDEARTRAEETPLSVALLTDPVGPRRIALAKAPLFYIALEDICGESQVRQALTHIVTLLRGQKIGYADLRSAIEETSNRSLGQMFRVWLNERGIPQDFRARYPLGTSAAETGE